MYQTAMRLLYGRHFRERYAALDAEIPDGAEVVDVCAGDCYLYLNYLRRKSVRYLGLDLSPRLVGWAIRHQVNARVFDVWEDDIPTADVVVMQASLYQFVPETRRVIERLLAASRDRVIISEPVQNLSSSRYRLLSAMSRYLTSPVASGHVYAGRRFDRASLTRLFRSFEAFERTYILPGGKEMIGVFAGQHRRDARAVARFNSDDVSHSIQ